MLQYTSHQSKSEKSCCLFAARQHAYYGANLLPRKQVADPLEEGWRVARHGAFVVATVGSRRGFFFGGGWVGADLLSCDEQAVEVGTERHTGDERHSWLGGIGLQRVHIGRLDDL